MAKRYSICRATGKRRYKDEISAKLALATAQRRGKGEKRHYGCGSCRGQHLTSQDRRTIDAATAGR